VKDKQEEKSRAANQSAKGQSSDGGASSSTDTAEDDEQILAYAQTFFRCILWPVLGFVARRIEPGAVLDELEKDPSAELAEAFLPWFRRSAILRTIAKSLGAPALLFERVRERLHRAPPVQTAPPSAPPPQPLSKAERNVGILQFDPAKFASKE
jgi:hypothetical protein